MFNKQFLAVFIIIFACHVAGAQGKGIVAGLVSDSTKPLTGATISISRVKDTICLAKTITSQDGRFAIQNLQLQDSLKIEISYVGFQSFYGLLVLKEKRFEMAPVILQSQSAELQDVVVKSERLVIVKGDTIEFSASRIQTPPNSMAGDLLKKVAGLEIRNGSLFYNGRPISKILVDGKSFFGEGGGVVLSNLPADMVDKIQIANDSLKAGEGKIQGELDHVLNLKLKPGIKYFANAFAGTGTDARYDGSSFGSRINDKNRISVFFGKNNINKASMNFNNNLQLPTGGSGTTVNTFGGFDYGTSWDSGATLNGSYNFGLPYTYNELITQKRQDILPGETLLTNSFQTSENRSSNHSARLEYVQGKKKNPFWLSGTGNYSSFHNLSANSSSTSNGQFNPLNALKSTYSSEGARWNGNISMGQSRQSNSNGKVFSWGLNYGYSGNKGIDHNDALSSFYNNNMLDSLSHLKQEIVNSSSNYTAGLNMEYRQPLGKHTALSFRDNFYVQWSHSDKTAWNLDTLGNKLKVDSFYSNYFRNHSLNNTTEINFNYTADPWNVTAGISLLQNRSDQQDIGRDSDLQQHNISPALRAEVNYTTKKSSLRLYSNANYSLPSIQQLQPVQDLTNPLYVVQGNPSLRPQINSSGSLTWNNRKVQVNGKPAAIISSMEVDWNAIKDEIATSTVFDSLGKQIVSYANVNGIYNLRGSMQFSVQQKWGKRLFSAGLRPGVYYNKDRSFINGVLYDNQSLNLQPSVNVSYSESDAVSLSFNYAPSWNNMWYEQNSSLNQSYILQSIDLAANLYFFKRFKTTQTASYSYNNSLPVDFDRSSLLWNAAASWLCFKSRKGEISCTAYDILKQFNNLYRSIGSNYIEDSKSNNMQRYFIFGFKYYFDKIADN